MKLNQVQIRVDPVSGMIYLCKAEYGKRPKTIGDITNQVVMALCADVSAGVVENFVERSVKFKDGMSCRIRVEMVVTPVKTEDDLKERIEQFYPDVDTSEWGMEFDETGYAYFHMNDHDEGATPNWRSVSELTPTTG